MATSEKGGPIPLPFLKGLRIVYAMVAPETAWTKTEIETVLTWLGVDRVTRPAKPTPAGEQTWADSPDVLTVCLHAFPYDQNLCTVNPQQAVVAPIFLVRGDWNAMSEALRREYLVEALSVGVHNLVNVVRARSLAVLAMGDGDAPE